MSNIPSDLVGNTAPLDAAQQLVAKIAQLQDALLTANPLMPSLLREIHTALQKDEELTYILKEDQINAVVNGLEKQTQVKIVSEIVAKKSSNSKASLSKLTLDDL